MTTSRMFTPQTALNHNVSPIDDHIKGLTEDVDFLKNALKNKNTDPYCAPEVCVTVYDNQRCSEKTALMYIEAQENRLMTLKKIKNNESITKEELNLINLIEDIKKDASIQNYKNIIQSPQPK